MALTVKVAKVEDGKLVLEVDVEDVEALLAKEVREQVERAVRGHLWSEAVQNAYREALVQVFSAPAGMAAISGHVHAWLDAREGWAAKMLRRGSGSRASAGRPWSWEALKGLREETGAPYGDCQTAMDAAEGDFGKAVDWLRRRGTVHGH